ncbi:hypothetical protein LIER_44030 [Lithospermum erythrorhizon]|uniref:Mitochondrial protein n=1 Tax=Lithospermum erythrorhizon TaxID=34254 RepID=A0AAV3RN68_LITER
MLHTHSVATPSSMKPPTFENASLRMSAPHEYGSLVGVLQYLSITLPDIIYAVNSASQFMHSPIELHLIEAKRILRYLVGSSMTGLLIKPSSKMTLKVYDDSDW